MEAVCSARWESEIASKAEALARTPVRSTNIARGQTWQVAVGLEGVEPVSNLKMHLASHHKAKVVQVPKPPTTPHISGEQMGGKAAGSRAWETLMTSIRWFLFNYMDILGIVSG